MLYADSRDPAPAFEERHLRILAALGGLATVLWPACVRRSGWRRRTGASPKASLTTWSARARASRSARLWRGRRPRSSTVLMRGESGTGKELVARALHQGEPARRPPLRRRQLRRPPRHAARERALRPRARRLHRRRRAQERPASRRPTAARSSSTRSASCRSRCRPSCCACSRSARSSASAATRDDPRRRPRRRRDQPRPRARDRDAGTLPRGPLLPAQRDRAHAAAAARAARGHPARWPRHFPAADQPRGSGRPAGGLAEARACLAALRLAGQRPRAGERGRARGDPGQTDGPGSRPEDLPEIVLESAPPLEIRLGEFQEVVQETKKQLILAAVAEAEGNITRAAGRLGPATHLPAPADPQPRSPGEMERLVRMGVP